MASPLVTVVVPAYQRPDQTQRAIDSVADQTHSPLELIVVDDGSSPPLADQLNLPDDCLDATRLIRLDENQGANAARNRGVREASGKFVSFLDSDDVLLEQHIEEAIRVLSDKVPEVGGVYTSYKIAKDGEQIDVRLATEALQSPREVVSEYKMGGFSCLTVRRDVFDTIGYLDEDLPASQDQEFMIRFLKEYDLHPVIDELLVYNLGDGRISNDSRRRIHAYDLVIEKHPKVFDQFGYSFINYAKGFQYAEVGEISKANKCFRSALKEEPTNALYWYQFFSSLATKRVFDLSNEAKRKLKLEIVAPFKKMVSR